MQQIKDSVFSVGANDAKRRLFDELIPLPDGTTYNSYLVKGSEKTVLLDAVDSSMQDVLLNNLDELKIKKIDYVVAHHAEQDHSGTIPAVLDKYPEAKVICSDKCKLMLMDLLNIPEDKFIVVKDREKMSLGNKTLEFIYTPWVHWPETVVTYLHDDRILFSCDFFGSHLAKEDLFFDDAEKIREAAKRYYAEIMMPFRTIIKANIETLAKYQIEIIAPSHGPIHTKPESIINLYKEWASDEVKNLAIIAYVSMHGSTKGMADYLEEALAKRGVAVRKYNLTGTDIGQIAVDLVDAATIMIGTPTVLAGIHPTAAHAVYLVNALRPKTRFVSIFGSFGWGARIVETVSSMIPGLKAEVIPPVIAKGLPKEKDFEALEEMAATIAEKHKGLK
ncbi:FprA family A-type flavoprotein [Candidatus Woesearchaeota archaeon]|nr:FprA family A-type flavoprotein [Candidatus Woesearchaeota archaeon]